MRGRRQIFFVCLNELHNNTIFSPFVAFVGRDIRGSHDSCVVLSYLPFSTNIWLFVHQEKRKKKKKKKIVYNWLGPLVRARKIKELETFGDEIGNCIVAMSLS